MKNLLNLEAAVFIDDLRTAPGQISGNGFLFRVHQVPVQGRVIKAELLLELFCQQSRPAAKRVGLGCPQGNMAIAVSTAEIFIKQGISHKSVYL